MTSQPLVTGERADLLETLALHRGFLRHTLNGLSDEQAALRPTASELCLGGLIKHVAATERQWLRFARGDTAAVALPDTEEKAEAAYRERAREFTMLPGETVTGVLASYDDVAAETARIVTDVPSLDTTYPLPEAPWFAPGARWSVRRVLLHVIAETSQHAGHADILRETIDGQKTMG
ncbi:DinB family protein [Saccharomonospora piscinae]|uniref:DinB family protein n=1 Tax=Saccharomonospora piscinae TaxID=687388 RepID=UPI00046568A9|nr:DinB family protein [Saccharomonospora piscinae]